MKMRILILLFLYSQLTYTQDYNFSLVSTQKGYQEKGVNESKLDSSFWKETDAKITISKDKCLIIENGNVREFKILSSEFKENPSRILIKTIKNDKKYDLELTSLLLKKREYFFYIQRSKLTEIYKIDKLIKTK